MPKWQAENVISIQHWKYFLCTEKENNANQPRGFFRRLALRAGHRLSPAPIRIYGAGMLVQLPEGL